MLEAAPGLVNEPPTGNVSASGRGQVGKLTPARFLPYDGFNPIY